jgi:hypothetical protein
VSLFRSLYRRSLPPVRPLQRDPVPVITTAITVDADGAAGQLEALADAADAAARAVDAALAAMPPRPQSPDHRMPPEVAWQRWSGDVDGGPPFTTPPGGTRREFDPCGRPGPKITIAARETT